MCWLVAPDKRVIQKKKKNSIQINIFISPQQHMFRVLNRGSLLGIYCEYLKHMFSWRNKKTVFFFFFFFFMEKITISEAKAGFSFKVV